MDIISFSKHIVDHRMDRNKAHTVESIVYIAIAAVLCGAESWNEIEMFGRSKEDYFRSRIPSFNGIPSHDTFNRFFSSIDTDYFERQFRYWVRQVCGKYKGVVAIDGKTIRGASKRSKSGFNLHIVSAFAAANGISMGQVKVNDKSNEITAIPELIEALDLKDCIVTIDAMGCQKDIAAKIIKAKADYILCVKDNHKRLHKELIEQFAQGDELLARGKTLPQSRWASYRTEEKAHGMREIRECTVYNNGVLDKIYEQWEGLQSIARIVSTRVELKTGKVTTEKRYYISSLGLDAKLIAESVRTHWSVENNLHWQLDVSFNEDRGRKSDNGAQNFSVICKMALALLKQDDKKASIVAKRKCAGWDNKYLDKLLAYI